MKEYKTISITKSLGGLGPSTLQYLSEESKEGWEVLSLEDNFILLVREIKIKKNGNSRRKK